MSELNTPPQLPEVTDEAGATPLWLPVVGLVLLALLALLLVVRQAQSPDEEASTAVQTAEISESE